MAKTIRNGHFLASGGGGATLHSAPGRLLGVLVSHSLTTAQIVQFYDDTAATPGAQILILSVQPYTSPFYLRFPRDQAIPFSTGLHVANGSCDINVWSVDHG
jgi:hypothetical protein